MAREEKVEKSNKYDALSADDTEGPESWGFRDLTLQEDDMTIQEVPGPLISEPPAEYPTDGLTTMWRHCNSAKVHDAKEERLCPSDEMQVQKDGVREVYVHDGMNVVENEETQEG